MASKAGGIPGVHREQCGQQVQRMILALGSALGGTSGVLGAALASSGQERQGAPGEGPGEATEMTGVWSIS